MSDRRSRGPARYVAAGVAAVLLVALCAGLTALAASLRAPTWTSTTTVVYGALSTDQLLSRDSLPDDPNRTLATQAELVRGDAVMSGAAQTLGVSASTLTGTTEVDNIADSNVLEISTTAGSADEAARRSQAVADQYIAVTRDEARQSLSAQASTLDQPIADLRTTIAAVPRRNRVTTIPALQASVNALLLQASQLRSAASSETGPVQVLAEARVPQSPSSVGVTTAAAVGAGLGIVLVLGIGLVLARPRPEGSDAHGSRVATPL